MSNMGNMGNMGNLGWLGVISPERADLPLVAQDNASELRVATPSWESRRWAGEWRAWLILDEFAKAECNISIEDWTRFDREKELEKLVNYAEDERASALPEIVAQDGLYVNFLRDFATILGISVESYPNTIALLHVGGIIGILVAMRLKYNPAHHGMPRPRPSQYLPALYPPVGVPGHPAYPSGHAVQAKLMALCVEIALSKHGTKFEGMCKLLHILAARIARNREIAGLHFPSDTEAGMCAAIQAMNILKVQDRFKEMVSLAADEWK